jgi:hypothetical protein
MENYRKYKMEIMLIWSQNHIRDPLSIILVSALMGKLDIHSKCIGHPAELVI